MPYLQSNLKIDTEPIFSIAKVPFSVLKEIIELKIELSRKCEEIIKSYDKRSNTLFINNKSFKLEKVGKIA